MCSIFGAIPLEVKDPLEVQTYTMIGANFLQHRGHEWYGLAFSNGKFLWIERRSGLIISSPDDRELVRLIKENQPQMIMFQTRFSTTGPSTSINAQPQFLRLRQGAIALGSNGDVFDYTKERERLEKSGCDFQSQNDSEILLHHILLNSGDDPDNIPKGIQNLMGNMPATFSFWLATEKRVYLARDPYGNRPLYYMQVGGYFIFASEDCALLAVLEERAEAGYEDGTVEINQVLPGEIIEVNLHGPVNYLKGADPKAILAQCTFEKVYFARPDSRVFGSLKQGRLCYKVLVLPEGEDDYVIQVLDDSVEEVGSFRYRLGENLGVESPVEQADCVISVPMSGDFAALGYAHKTGTEFQIGLVRNPYYTRTFTSPGRENRQRLARLKYQPMRGLYVRAKRIVVVDDSVIFATTLQRLARKLRIAGAQEVHGRVSCPPVKCPCPYGIDMSSKGQLPAASMSMKEVGNMLKLDSLAHLSLEMLQAANGASAKHYCYACWNGEFPIHY